MANMPTYPRSNCYFGCILGEKDSLHHFPKPDRDTDRFSVWKEILDEEIKKKGDKYIYNQIRLCDKHFENYYISPSKILTRNAVPTLHIKQDCVVGPVSREVQSVGTEPVPTTSNVGPAFREVQSIGTEPVPSTSNVGPVSKEVQSIGTEPVPTTTIVEDKEASRKRKHNNDPTKSTKGYNVVNKLKEKIVKLTLKCKSKTEKIKAAKRILEAKSFLKSVEGLPPTVKTFVKMQLKAKNKAKGRKFTSEEKIIAASIMKQSQKGYNFLSKILVLPSKRTIQRLLSSFTVKPGINENILKNLKENVDKLPLEKRIFTLLFDEVALSPGLYFQKDGISGFEDFGNNKRTHNIADHAFVMMIKGVKSKKKQPILFTFCKSATKKFQLKELIVSTIKRLKDAGIIIIATICDQATSNVSAIKMLQKETREKYLRKNVEYTSSAFEVDDMKIFPLFDTPHLLKGVRNNFITKNIRFSQDNKVKIAKWAHLRMLLNEDRGEDEVRIINKLTEYHVDPEKIPKMKVKYAAQVFSQRVSAVMRFLAKRNILPEECEDTADLLLIFDKLFDSFNGHSYQGTAKALKGCLKHNSKHFQFWDELIPILKSIEFEKSIKKTDGTEIIKYEKVPSVQNWISNINVFKEMFTYLTKNFNINNILTRTFNQDPLENFFCCIRSHGVRNINPTCVQFTNAYKTLLINNMNSAHSINANCEKDDYKQLQSMNFLISERSECLSPPDYSCEVDSLITTMNEVIANDSILHAETKKYVAGYIIKKSKSKVFKNCNNCMKDLQKSHIDSDSFNYLIDYTKKSLFYAKDDFVFLLNEIYFMIITCLRDSPEITFLKEKIIFFINCRCDFSIITCQKHKSVLVDYIINLSINLIVHSWCTGVNRILNGKIVNFDHNDKVKLQAFNYSKCHKKRK